MNLWYQKKALKQNAQRLGNIVGWITIITALSMVIIVENMALENAQKYTRGTTEPYVTTTARLNPTGAPTTERPDPTVCAGSMYTPLI